MGTFFVNVKNTMSTHSSSPVGGIGVHGSLAEEELHHVEVALSCGQVEGRAAVVVSQVEVHPSHQVALEAAQSTRMGGVHYLRRGQLLYTMYEYMSDVRGRVVRKLIS